MPAADLERERSIYRAQFENSNKPPAIVDKIVEGKLNSYYEQVVLTDQPSIRDPKTTIGTMITAAIAKLGENITVARFARFKVGEDRFLGIRAAEAASSVGQGRSGGDRSRRRRFPGSASRRRAMDAAL